ncbi:MAG: hypothetical protein VKJ46_08675 [Leptolyngbyaceae bacterium]|nr:hypothetical protein [Leptolyngbyaceae bacterium]
MLKYLRVLMVLVGLIGFGTGFYFTSKAVGSRSHAPLFSSKSENQGLVQQPEAASVTEADPYVTAIRWADNSVALMQSAKSRNQWQLVANQWQKAIQLMNSLPGYHPKYREAQSKILEYQRYLADADRQVKAWGENQPSQYRRPKLSTPDKTSKLPLAKFMVELRALDPNSQTIADVSLGSKPGHLKLTVRNAFHYQPYPARLKAAQGLWWMWANSYSPHKPDQALIELLDFGGHRVGGSEKIGSAIKVKSPIQ